MRFRLQSNPAVWAAVLLLTLSTSVRAQEEGEIQVESTRFAPGTVNVVPPAPVPEETFTGPLTLRDLIDAHPEIEWTDPDFPEGKPYFDARTRTLVEMAKQVILRREIHCLEFAFKPLRQMYVDIPQPNGRLQRKLIWYMVYRVRYTGGDLRAAQAGGTDKAIDKLYSRIEKISRDSRRFFPLVTLVDHESGAEFTDRVIPAAKDLITRREKITAPVYNSVEITSIPIPRSSDPAAEGVWGVLTWEDVNPDVDFLSLYVYGLTNAFKKENPDEITAQRPTLIKKALQLNFFRPGDAVAETEDRVRFGVPAFRDQEEQDYVLKLYGLEKRVDYQWIYR